MVAYLAARALAVLSSAAAFVTRPLPDYWGAVALGRAGSAFPSLLFEASLARKFGGCYRLDFWVAVTVVVLPEPTDPEFYCFYCFVEWLLLPFDLIVARLTGGAACYTYEGRATAIFCLTFVSDDVRYFF